MRSEMRLEVDLSLLRDASRRMGAHHHNVEMVVRRNFTPLAPIDIQLDEGVELSMDEVQFSDGLVSHKGRQVLLYIQDHGMDVEDVLEDGSLGRKFHLANCVTLQKMRSKNRFDRYVVTNRLDGYFYITGQDLTGKRVEGKKARLKVCKNCLSYLNYKGYESANEPGYAGYQKRTRIFESFELAGFFEDYSSFFAHMPSRFSGEFDGDYTEDWEKVSKSIRSTRDFVCEICRTSLKDVSRLCHAHHMNGVKTDNRESNLQVLCADCHRKQPMHEHMHVLHEDMRRIAALRREQGTNKACSWNEVFNLSDPGVHGALDYVRREFESLPEVGYFLSIGGGPNCYLELAWPTDKYGICISEETKRQAQLSGWKVDLPNEITAREDLRHRNQPRGSH